MYQGIKNTKHQSIFSRSGLAALAAAGVVALPLMLSPQASLATEGHPAMPETSGSTSMDHSGMSMKGKHMSMDGKAMPMDHEGMSTGSKKMHESMMKGMEKMQSMTMTGNTEQDFAMMMMEHHKAAMDMAQIELKYGKDAKLRSMAKNIIASQKAEIKQFERWLERHNQTMTQPMSK